MRSKISIGLAAVLLWAQFGVPSMAFAWKPKPPLCFINCAVPVGFIEANPATVLLPSSSTAGSTELRWNWNFLDVYGNEFRKGATFPLACIYVRMNAAAHASVVQCEWPGHTYTSNVSWIVAGNMYTFTLSPYVGDTVSIYALGPIIATPGKRTSVDVIGVLR